VPGLGPWRADHIQKKREGVVGRWRSSIERRRRRGDDKVKKTLKRICLRGDRGRWTLISQVPVGGTPGKSFSSERDGTRYVGGLKDEPFVSPPHDSPHINGAGGRKRLPLGGGRFLNLKKKVAKAFHPVGGSGAVGSAQQNTCVRGASKRKRIVMQSRPHGALGRGGEGKTSEKRVKKRRLLILNKKNNNL